MFSTYSEDLAISNAIEVTKGITKSGFVPNSSSANGNKSSDRSQCPVGSWFVWELYQKNHKKWFLKEVYNELLRWNRWWIKNRITPFNFNPVFAGLMTQKQVDSLVKRYYFSPEYFYGEWMIPSIARNDPAYEDQEYVRGRIWPMLNFFVYKGLKQYHEDAAAKDLAEKSHKLLMKTWLAESAIYENFNAITGEGNDKGTSDSFYHWGALLGYIYMLEEGALK